MNPNDKLFAKVSLLLLAMVYLACCLSAKHWNPAVWSSQVATGGIVATSLCTLFSAFLAYTRADRN